MANVQRKLISLAGQWKRLKTSVFEEYTSKTTEDGPEGAEDEVFSTLKFIKNRLGSSHSQQHLEAYMLMATQPDVLKMLDCDQIIDGIAEKSDLLKKLLIE